MRIMSVTPLSAVLDYRAGIGKAKGWANLMDIILYMGVAVKKKLSACCSLADTSTECY
jgi:hypothetical protein